MWQEGSGDWGTRYVGKIFGRGCGSGKRELDGSTGIGGASKSGGSGKWVGQLATLRNKCGNAGEGGRSVIKTTNVRRCPDNWERRNRGRDPATISCIFPPLYNRSTTPASFLSPHTWHKLHFISRCNIVTVKYRELLPRFVFLQAAPGE